MLEIKNLVKAYGRNRVLDGVTAQFASERVHMLVGPNGAGKSTLLRCLLGLESYEGSVTWNGHPLTPGRHIAAPVFDTATVYPKLTGHQNLKVLSPQSVGGPHVYLTERRMRAKVSTYSHGERMRLALMMALNSTAPFLVLDEPSGGLDYTAVGQLVDDLTNMIGSRTVLIVDHNSELYSSMVATTNVLESGHLAQTSWSHE